MLISVDGWPLMVYRYGMETLKTLMKKAGLNNPSLAKKVGCSPVEIWRLANYPDKKDSRPMTAAWAERIAPHLGVLPHELLFDYETAPQAEENMGQTIEIRGEIGRGLWAKKKDMRSEKSNIPKLNGRYWNYEQFAYKTKNSMAIASPPGVSEYVICVDLFSVRKEPLDGDIVIVEFTEGEMVERQLYQVSRKGKDIHFEQISHVSSDEHPHHILENLGDNGAEFTISDLVIGWIAFT
jgi:hypothetical protein